MLASLLLTLCLHNRFYLVLFAKAIAALSKASAAAMSNGSIEEAHANAAKSCI